VKLLICNVIDWADKHSMDSLQIMIRLRANMVVDVIQVELRIIIITKDLGRILGLRRDITEWYQWDLGPIDTMNLFVCMKPSLSTFPFLWCLNINTYMDHLEQCIMFSPCLNEMEYEPDE
jgi:hypothetical protein